MGELQRGLKGQMRKMVDFARRKRTSDLNQEDLCRDSGIKEANSDGEESREKLLEATSCWLGQNRAEPNRGFGGSCCDVET